ncbi:MAG: oxygenase MpaB family protein [Micromonosporaceae bacterium]
MQPEPFSKTAGAARSTPSTADPGPGDVRGLFREGSIYRRVSGEGVVLAGGAAALLLQLAHPDVARGVAEHSDFAANRLARLRGTLEFVYVVAFGSREEAERHSAAVRRMHDAVAGPGYRADDPELQVWVNATLFATALRIYCSVFGPLNDEEMEEFWAGAKLLAGMLGCPETAGPPTAAEFFPYWHRMVNSLEVTDTARELAQTILHPPWPGFTAPVQATARFVTAGLLPAPIREQYGMVWSARRERILTAGTALTRVVYPHLPRAVRQAPKAYCLRGLRARMPASA